MERTDYIIRFDFPEGWWKGQKDGILNNRIMMMNELLTFHYLVSYRFQRKEYR